MPEELLLDSLEIKGYRCFEHLTIEKLGRVNLIVGKNNVGKTALLEALWLYCNEGRIVPHILSNRFEDKLPLNSLNNKIKGYKHLLNRLIVAPQQPLFLVKSVKNPEALVGRFEDGLRFLTTPKYILNTFVKSDGLNKDEITEIWDTIELTPKEDDVTDSMKFILPKLLRVRVRNVQNNERIPFVQTEDFEEPLPLKSFGDGLNRLFGVSLALVNCKDGMLLIDEIENGFHYSVLPDVWKLIFKTAKDLNVQVFATTHSKDCVEAFTQAAIDDEESKGMLIRLERHGERIVAKTVDEETLADAVDYGVEVR